MTSQWARSDKGMKSELIDVNKGLLRVVSMLLQRRFGLLEVSSYRGS